MRGLYGTAADVAWPAVAGQVLTLAPGASPGHRTLYIEAYDAGGLAASQLAVVSLGRGPVAAAIPTVDLFTGADAVVRLDDHFSDPDGDALSYAVAVSVPHVVSTRLARRQVVSAGSISTATDLHLHGVTAGDVVLTVTATDPIGLTVAGTVDVTVRASAVASPAPMLGDGYFRAFNRLVASEGVAAQIVRSTTSPAKFNPGQLWISDSSVEVANAILPEPLAGATGDVAVLWLSGASGPINVGGQSLGTESGLTNVAWETLLRTGSPPAVGDRCTIVGYPSDSIFEILEVFDWWPRSNAARSALLMSDGGLAGGFTYTIAAAVAAGEPTTHGLANPFFYSYVGESVFNLAVIANQFPTGIQPSDEVTWLPSVATDGPYPVTYLDSRSFPRDFATLSDYLAGAVAAIVTDHEVAAGDEISITESGARYVVQERRAKYYRSRRLFWEVTLGLPA